LQIAVNLSPVQFRHGDLPGLVHPRLVGIEGLLQFRLHFCFAAAISFSKRKAFSKACNDCVWIVPGTAF